MGLGSLSPRRRKNIWQTGAQILKTNLLVDAARRHDNQAAQKQAGTGLLRGRATDPAAEVCDFPLAATRKLIQTRHERAAQAPGTQSPQGPRATVPVHVVTGKAGAHPRAPSHPAPRRSHPRCVAGTGPPPDQGAGVAVSQVPRGRQPSSGPLQAGPRTGHSAFPAQAGRAVGRVPPAASNSRRGTLGGLQPSPPAFHS